ncbi:PspC domain-containing protein [Nocardioides sambongensis]|uniref:PspC domain-containing protein n=1 Tax=Nocardioides sambongensis TaxID=2589074 RepID=UPI00112CF9BD|nr:PspC domain-containing protein [Nocardioides sambongensis]
MNAAPPPPDAPGRPDDPGSGPADAGPRVSHDEMRDLGRMRRSTREKKIAGIAAGVARHFDVDPLVVRVVLVVLAFFGAGASSSTPPAGCCCPATTAPSPRSGSTTAAARWRWPSPADSPRWRSPATPSAVGTSRGRWPSSA